MRFPQIQFISNNSFFIVKSSSVLLLLILFQLLTGCFHQSTENSNEKANETPEDNSSLPTGYVPVPAMSGKITELEIIQDKSEYEYSVNNNEFSLYTFNAIKNNIYRIRVEEVSGDIDLVLYDSVGITDAPQSNNLNVIAASTGKSVEEILVRKENNISLYFSVVGKIESSYKIFIDIINDSPNSLTFTPTNLSFESISPKKLPDNVELLTQVPEEQTYEVANPQFYYIQSMQQLENSDWLEVNLNAGSVSLKNIDIPPGEYINTIRYWYALGYSEYRGWIYPNEILYKDMHIKLKLLNMPFTIVDNTPDTIDYSKQLQSSIDILPKEEVISELYYAPNDLLFSDEGMISWKPLRPLFGNSMDFNYGIKIQWKNYNFLYKNTVSVIDNDRPLPLVRTSFNAPFCEYCIKLINLDTDLNDEILVTDKHNLIYSIKYIDDKFVQNWVYPYNVSVRGTISGLTTKDINEDGISEFFVGAEDLKIIDGKSQKIIKEIIGDENTYYSPVVEDFDDDDNFELVILKTYRPSGKSKILIYDTKTWGLEWESEEFDIKNNAKTDLWQAIEYGNIDSSTDISIATRYGHVIRYNSEKNEYEIEWVRTDGFGKAIIVKDLNNDSIDEIVAIDSNNIRVFDFKGSQIGSMQFDETLRNYTVANIDEDENNEIIIAKRLDQNSLTVLTMDTVSGELVVKDTIELFYSGYFGNLSVGDVDGNGTRDILYSDTINSSRDQQIRIASRHNGTYKINLDWAAQFSYEPQAPGSFSGGKNVKVSLSEEKIIFATDGIFRDEYVNLIDINPGNGEKVDANNFTKFQRNKGIEVRDINSDGIDELAVYSGTGIDIYSYLENSILWGRGGWCCRAISFNDINGDGHDEIIFGTGQIGVWRSSPSEAVYIYDILNNRLLWESESLRAVKILISDVDHEPGDEEELVIAADSKITIYKLDPATNTYTEIAFIEEAGIRDMILMDVTGDGINEFVIGSNYPGGYFRVYKYINGKFEIVSTHSKQGSHSVIFRDELGVSGRNIIISDDFINSNLTSAGYSNIDGTMKSIDALSGRVVWQSPPLLGRIAKNSLNFIDHNNDGVKELVFGTSKGMYFSQ